MAERLLKVVQTETEGGLVSYLSRVRTAYAKVNPHFIDAIFLSNHDTPRVMTALDGDMHHAKMAASLLLTLPGAPFLYYGEEIGMFGPKPDPRIREPIRWGGEEDAHSPTSLPRLANRDGPVYHEVERDPMGLYRHYRTMIYLRRSLPALVYGDIAEAHVRAHGLVAFYRRDKEEHLLVLHNVGQAALDLSLEGEHRSFTLVYGTHVDNHLSSDGRMVHLAPYSTTILRERP
ncbi:MAG: alpha-amylase family glycosyl hydrolase [Candidatus Carbobacillus sp.]|nr:alpha-amylase family glycosyl hydrolase [Candidatus Carbobacillus sp.]